MRLSLIVAMSRNRVIGRDAKLPWRLSADLQRFKRLTMGHPIIMGRKTFESIGRALPGRTSIVVTRQAEWAFPQILVARNLDEAIELASDSDEGFVIGGEQIYRQALPRVTRMYITAIDAEVPGDAYFPAYDETQWQLVEETVHEADAKNEYPFRYLTYDRIGSL